MALCATPLCVLELISVQHIDALTLWCVRYGWETYRNVSGLDYWYWSLHTFWIKGENMIAARNSFLLPSFQIRTFGVFLLLFLFFCPRSTHWHTYRRSHLVPDIVGDNVAVGMGGGGVPQSLGDKQGWLTQLSSSSSSRQPSHPKIAKVFHWGSGLW